MSSQVATEQQPLLTAHESDNSRPTTSRWAGHSVRVFCHVLLITAMSGVTSSLLPPALTEMIEMSICRAKYPDVTDTRKDPRCKNEHVQPELAVVLAGSMMAQMTAGILAAIPFGMLADRIGRRPVLLIVSSAVVIDYTVTMILCMFPEIFPIRSIWLVELFLVFGGGAQMFYAILDIMICDAAPLSFRSSALFYNSAALLGAMVLASPLTYIMMRRGAVFTFSCGIFGVILIIFVALALPETLHLMPRHQEHQEPTAEEVTLSNIQARVKASLRKLRESIKSLVVVNTGLRLPLVVMALTTLGNYHASTLMQYITKRFEISWGEANFLMSIKTFVTLGLVALVMPAASEALVAAKVLPARKDIWMARICLAITVMGLFGIALSVNLVQLAGSLAMYGTLVAYQGAMKSLMTQIFGNDNIGLLFAAVSLVDSVGNLGAAPALAWLFNIGLRWGQAWYGLPYMVFASIMSVAVLLLFFVKTR